MQNSDEKHKCIYEECHPPNPFFRRYKCEECGHGRIVPNHVDKDAEEIKQIRRQMKVEDKRLEELNEKFKSENLKKSKRHKILHKVSVLRD